MANLGEKAEIVNASELALKIGADTYILLTNLQIHVGRTEARDVTTDGGPVYSYGAGDNWFTATLLMTDPEVKVFNTKTQIDANGAMPSTDWLVVGTNVSGATVTWAATGVLRDYDITKAPEGKVSVDIFVRITGDTVTTS